MKRISLTKLIESCSSKLIKLSGLFAISCSVLTCSAFSQNKISKAKETKSEQAQETKDKKQPTVQTRIPDDLTDNLYLPLFVNECLDKNKGLIAEINVPDTPLHNPYFVRGDFDGDQSNDYAVIVESRKNKSEGLLVCFRNKETKSVLLGLDTKNPPAFWLLMNWDVETKEEVSKETDADGKLIGITPKGESIVMKGEDWIGIIYWDGKIFRWKKVILFKSD